jgi:hypothetical protein
MGEKLQIILSRLKKGCEYCARGGMRSSFVHDHEEESSAGSEPWEGHDRFWNALAEPWIKKG